MCGYGVTIVIRVQPLSTHSGRYYVDDPAREVRDVTNAGSGGVWVGAGAKKLGLEGSVELQTFDRVLAGQPPGSTLTGFPRRQRTAFDLIVAAPKCVSILFAAPDHEVARAVVHAHHDAIDAVVRYLQDRALTVTRRESHTGEVRALPVDGAIAARFTHGVSRSGDPHLHSHLIVANMAHDSDGRFGALDARSLTAHRHAADALYRAHLRERLARDLSLTWERDLHGREQIAGIDNATIACFSGRQAQRRQGDWMMPDKEMHSRATFEERWEERRRQAPLFEGSPRVVVRGETLDEHRFSGTLYGGTIHARRLIVAWAESAPGGVRASTIDHVLSKLNDPLGRGVYETPLRRVDVQPSQHLLRVLGSRPTDRSELDRWWARSRLIERVQESPRRALSGDRERPRRDHAVDRLGVGQNLGGQRLVGFDRREDLAREHPGRTR